MIKEEVIGFITISVALISAIVLVLAPGMFALADNYPNNTALYLSVLEGLATIIAIIASTVTIVASCKTDIESEHILGYSAWWILAILSLSFALASAIVVIIEKMEDNPYHIWNLIQ